MRILLTIGLAPNIFWQLSHEKKARLLQFTCGTARVPVEGFRALKSYDGRACKFCIQSIKRSEGMYPRSHTCFNRCVATLRVLFVIPAHVLCRARAPFLPPRAHPPPPPPPPLLPTSCLLCCARAVQPGPPEVQQLHGAEEILRGCPIYGRLHYGVHYGASCVGAPTPTRSHAPHRSRTNAIPPSLAHSLVLSYPFSLAHSSSLTRIE